MRTAGRPSTAEDGEVEVEDEVGGVPASDPSVDDGVWSTVALVSVDDGDASSPLPVTGSERTVVATEPAA